MIVFSNTTPFIALASIGRLELLPRLFETIHVAESVVEECAEGGPVLVPDLRSLPWVIVVPDQASTSLPALFELDRGEKQTILLAMQHRADKAIIDERLGRRVAEYLGLDVIGTLGILAKAKSLGLIPSFTAAAQAMRQQGIHYHPGLIDRLARHLGETAP